MPTTPQKYYRISQNLECGDCSKLCIRYTVTQREGLESSLGEITQTYYCDAYEESLRKDYGVMRCSACLSSSILGLYDGTTVSRKEGVVVRTPVEVKEPAVLTPPLVPTLCLDLGDED